VLPVTTDMFRHHPDLVNRYGVAVLQVTTDMFRHYPDLVNRYADTPQRLTKSG
jgi:pterin-4a-carbinolamine dehydratase